MNNKIKKVLIVGGGIGGLSAGIGLRKAGIAVTIAELQPQYNVYGVGIIQQANALRALDALGVADEAMRLGSPYATVKMCTPDGHVFGEAGTPPIGRFPSHNGISRKILHDVLADAAIAAGVIFKMGTTVETLDNLPDDVHVVFTDGTSGTYDLLVAADGIYSKIRTMEFGAYKSNYVGLSVWRYPFKRPADLDTGYIYLGRKSKIGFIPMTADTCYMFLVSAEGADNPFIAEDELIPKLKAYMQEFPVPMVQQLIPQVTNPKEVNYRPLETLHMQAPWYKNRVIVIGDAAHATIPQLGSGAALAIEDAVVLSELIQSNTDIPQMLEAFMQRRYERCRMVVDASETLGRWELMQFEGKQLPEGANVGALMGKTCGALTAPI
jgi:2-polyprenyl-6-methoxyphenol hydroxylase-like FAD-dependent oxidoreductase